MYFKYFLLLGVRAGFPFILLKALATGRYPLQSLTLLFYIVTSRNEKSHMQSLKLICEMSPNVDMTETFMLPLKPGSVMDLHNGLNRNFA